MSARAVLAIWNDIAPEHAADYEDWYQHEHLADRVGVPGFLGGRRYLAIDGQRPRYFTCYQIEDIAALTAPPYRARLEDPTAWTRRMMARWQDMDRSACRVLASAGRGLGGAAVALRFDAEPGREAALEDWIGSVLVPDLGGRTGIVKAQLWRGDAAASGLDSVEARLREAPDRTTAWALMVEVAGTDALDAATAALDLDALRAQGGTDLDGPRRYRLLHALFKSDLARS